MSDMLEDVALAIYREDLNQPEAKRIPGILRNYNERMADRAIAAAEPHLRRKHRQELLDELIADSIGDNWCALTLSQDTGSFPGSQYMGTLADWLKSHGDAE